MLNPDLAAVRKIMGEICNRISVRGLALALAVACLAACGADSTRYGIGGTVSGLTGPGLMLTNNHSDNLAVNANGSFAFTPGFPGGASYEITVKVQPDGQACVVTHGTGTVGAAAVTDVSVVCVAAAPMALMSVVPANGSTGIARASPATLTFSAPLVTQEDSTGITLQSGAGMHPLSTSVSGSTLTITPRRKLLPLTSYSLTVGKAVRGAAGEQLPAAVTTTFTTADAAWQPAGLLSPETPDQTFDPQIAMNEKGDLIAVWRQPDARVRSRLYTASSGWGPVSILEGPAGLAPAQTLVLDDSDNAIAVWETSESFHCGDETTCSRARLWTSSFSAREGWGEPRRMASSSHSGSMDAHIVMNAAGDAVLVWAEDDGDGSRIWAKRYTVKDGWSGAVKIQTQQSSVGAIQIAMDESGNAMVIWAQRNGLGEDIWANRYSAGSWGTAVRIDNDNAHTGNLPVLAMNEHGEASAAWLQYDGQGFNVWFNRFSRVQGWGSAELVADHAESAIRPAVAIDASGNSLLVWQELYHEGNNFRVNVWSKWRGASSGWGVSTRLINTTQADAHFLAMDESGNAIALWSQRDSNRSSVWSARYMAGIGWGAPTLLENDDAGDAAATGIDMNLSGDATVVWHQSDGEPFSGGRMHAYYRRFE